MRIALAGVGVESNLFSRHITRYDDFVIQRENALVGSYDLEMWVGPRSDQIDWIGTMNAHADYGGAVEPDDYDRIEDEITERLAAAVADSQLDGVYLDLHGAGHVVGRNRLEEHLLRRVRETVGEECVISVSMDPHGNFSSELASLVDLATAHRHAPHIDTRETWERAIVNLVRVLDRGQKPRKAWVRVPVLLPGERTSTLNEPGATVFLSAGDAAAEFGVLDASIWIGFAWADEDRNAGAVMVTGYDDDAITRCASTLARRFWDAREAFEIVTDHWGSWDEALDFVEHGNNGAPAPGPVWIADSGDNVTAGASGDITFALRATLERPSAIAGRRWLFSGIVDPDSLKAAIDAGIGATLGRAIGAVLDSRFGHAVTGPWTVVELVDGMHGEGIVAAVLEHTSTEGTLHVSLHGIRIKFTSPDDPSMRNRPGQVWHDVSSYDVIVVKNGYLFPGQVERAASTFMALTPGGTDLDFERWTFSQLWRPLYPLDRDFEADLTPEFIPVVGSGTAGRPSDEDRLG
jgi:microcystin degradation protein MlrC